MRSVQFKAGGISKSFGGSKALDGASLEVLQGEVHGLVGENGAGKSTLVNIIGGAVHRDAGTMELLQQAYNPQSPRDSYANGIAVVHQHLSLISGLSVADNIFLGRYTTNQAGFVKRSELEEQAGRILARLGAEDIPGRALVGSLSTPKKYLVEIAKALVGKPYLVILDEPTASLGSKETNSLFSVVREIVKRNTSVIWITHRLEELDQIASRTTVMRDGRTVDVIEPNGEFDRKRVIKSMTGRTDIVERRHVGDQDRAEKLGAEGESGCIRFNHVSTDSGLEDINFTVRRGEIVAVGGLVGSGMEKIASIFCGRDRIIGGHVEVGKVSIKSSCRPLSAVEIGIFHLPADRAQEGIFPHLSVAENMTISNLKGLSNPLGLLHRNRLREVVDRNMQDLDIRPNRTDIEMRFLSGGNQQKVIFGRAQVRRPQFAILEEPTQGVDIAAKAEIYTLIEKWCETGAAVLIISTDTREVLTVPDRILSMYRGQIVAEFKRDEVTEESLVKSYFGVLQ